MTIFEVTKSLFVPKPFSYLFKLLPEFIKNWLTDCFGERSEVWTDRDAFK